MNLMAAMAAFAFATLITPGPNNMMLMASGLNYGWRRTIPHMLGIVLGFPFMVGLVGLGIMQLFEAVPHSALTFKGVCAAYLLYLAWRIATTEPRGDSGPEVGSSQPLTFLQAAMFQWVNPKAWAMAVTAVSLYTPPGHPMWSVALVALIFALIGTVSVSAWTFLGQELQRFLKEPAALRAFNMICGLILALSLYPMLAGGLPL